MAYRPASELLKRLEAFDSQAWDGFVWRQMFADNPPTRPNVKGARWNPPGVPAIYCSLDRDTAIAEGNYAAEVQPLRPTAKRTVYKLHLSLEKVLDLSSQSVLLELGISEREFANVDHTACQRMGGAVESLEHDGLIVPSARGSAGNLVVFPRKQGPQADFEIVDSEIVSEV